MGHSAQIPPTPESENEKPGESAVPVVRERVDLEQGRRDKKTAEGEVVRTHDEQFLVMFDPGNSEDPKNWSTKIKWGVTFALSASGFNRIMISTMAPAITTIAVDLHMSTTEATMALSVYLLATAFGPLILGPLSEVYGRKPVIHATNLWSLAWNLVCGFANSGGLLITARLLAGFGASAVYTLAYGVLGDVWRPEQRGRSLSLYLLLPLLGAAAGPILGGEVVQYASTWRWMFWATSILQGTLELCTLPLLHETYAPLLLHRRADKLRKQTGDARYHTEAEKRDAGRTAAWKLRNSLPRPLRLLAFHPIIQLQSLLEGLNYGLLYFALASFSTLFVSAYGESISTSGLHYLAICLGELLGAQLCGPLMDYVYHTLTARARGHASPELRVPLLLPSLLLTPAGLLLYGWAAQSHLPRSVVDVGAALLALGMQVFDTTLHAYVMNAYPEHVSSAAAATQVLRSLLAVAFPLFSAKMHVALGYGWGNSLSAGVALAIGLPSTAVLWRYGAALRAKNESSF